MLSAADQAIPVLLDVFWRAADLRDGERELFGGNHLDRVPRADRQLVGVRLLLRNVDADFAPHAALEVDLAPRLIPLHTQMHLFEFDAIDGANLQARLAPGAVIGIDNGIFLGEFFTRSSFGHIA